MTHTEQRGFFIPSKHGARTPRTAHKEGTRKSTIRHTRKHTLNALKIRRFQPSLKHSCAHTFAHSTAQRRKKGIRKKNIKERKFFFYKKKGRVHARERTRNRISSFLEMKGGARIRACEAPLQNSCRQFFSTRRLGKNSPGLFAHKSPTCCGHQSSAIVSCSFLLLSIAFYSKLSPFIALYCSLKSKLTPVSAIYSFQNLLLLIFFEKIWCKVFAVSKPCRTFALAKRNKAHRRVS